MQNSLIKTDVQTELSHLLEGDFFSIDASSKVFMITNQGLSSVHAVESGTDTPYFSFPKDFVVTLWSWKN